jgi:hypothetical protein
MPTPPEIIQKWSVSMGSATIKSFAMIILTCLCAGGCASAPLLNGQYTEARQVGKTLVMMKNELKWVAGPQLLKGRPFRGFGWHVANMEKEEQLILVERIALADESNKDGWVYLLLEPGIYYVDLAKYSNHPDPLRFQYWFHIPQEKPAVYVGTITGTCVENGGCSRLEIWDTSLFTHMPKPVLDTWGAPMTSLLKPYTGKHSPLWQSKSGPVGLDVTNRAVVETPDWVKRAVSLAIGTGGEKLPDRYEENEVAKAAMDDLVNIPGSGLNVIVTAPLGVAHLLYLPIGYSIGKIWGSKSEEKWQPCMTAISEKIKQYDSMAAFRKEIGALVDVAHLINIPSDTNGGTSVARIDFEQVLEVELSRIMVRECSERGSFCLDMTAHVKLYDKDAVSYYGHYVYSNSDRRGDTKERKMWSYEIILDDHSKCREIETFCAQDGTGILLEEVEGGIRALAKSIANNLFWQAHGKN